MRRSRYGTTLPATDVDEFLFDAGSGWQGSRGMTPEYGRLYPSSGDHRLQPAGEQDRSVLIGRSGRSGYRGGRPFFGADVKMSMGPLQYEGPQLGGVVLGLAAALLAWQVATRSKK